MKGQCGGVTGSRARGWAPFLLASVGAAGAARRELLFGVLGAETLARDLDEVGAVRQSIERSRGQQRLPEELGPLGAIAIAREQDRAAFVPLVDDVVEVLGPGHPQRLEPEV